MVKLTTKTVSIIARLGNTGIQVGPHRHEGQHIIVRADGLLSNVPLSGKRVPMDARAHQRGLLFLFVH
jgi:hypothetical protein